MSLFAVSIILTALLYVLLVYKSYISVFILYSGINYGLILPTLKSSVFIVVCYISIIADIVLFDSSMYVTIVGKNGTLLIISIFSFVYAKTWKGE